MPSLPHPPAGAERRNGFAPPPEEKAGKKARRDCRPCPLVCLLGHRRPCSGRVGPQAVPPFRPRPGVCRFPRCQQARRPLPPGPRSRKPPPPGPRGQPPPPPTPLAVAPAPARHRLPLARWPLLSPGSRSPRSRCPRSPPLAAVAEWPLLPLAPPSLARVSGKAPPPSAMARRYPLACRFSAGQRCRKPLLRNRKRPTGECGCGF